MKEESQVPAPAKDVKLEPAKEVKPAPAKEVKPAPAPVKETVAVQEKVVPATTVDYDAMKVSELRDLAKEKGLSGYSTLKKAELVDLLKQA